VSLQDRRLLITGDPVTVRHAKTGLCRFGKVLRWTPAGSRIHVLVQLEDRKFRPHVFHGLTGKLCGTGKGNLGWEIV